LDLVRVHKKLLETQFFLYKMIKQERRIFIGANPYDPFEQFDHYLSAFLSAARTVDYRLRHEQKAIYPDWRKAWDASLTLEENALIKFMVDDRNVEVHRSGSSRNEAREGIGTVTIGGMPPAVADKITFNFTIEGAERKVTEGCAAYLALLQRMVAQFEADHSYFPAQK
jgi:hypothetical protein